MLNVFCVLRSGGDYNPDYVHILRDSVERNLSVPHRFACLTDLSAEYFAGIEVIPLRHDWPGWWSKMELFRHSTRERLVFDLDTVITGPINDLPKAANGQFTILEDFYRGAGTYGSGLMYLPEGWGLHIYQHFLQDPERHMAENRGDQDFLESMRPKAQTWRSVGLQPGKIVSFKPVPLPGATLSKLPKGASVVCFHGLPRPADLPEHHWTREFWRRETWDEHLGHTGTDDL